MNCWIIGKFDQNTEKHSNYHLSWEHSLIKARISILEPLKKALENDSITLVGGESKILVTCNEEKL